VARPDLETEFLPDPQTDMKLKRPNLNADPHAECYLSVHKNRTGCGISTAMADAIDAKGGKYLHFAIDDQRRPWTSGTHCFFGLAKALISQRARFRYFRYFRLS